MKRWIIAVLVATIAIGGALGAFAATQQTTANVEVTVWQSVSDGALFLSTKPEGGKWTTHNTALDMSKLSVSERFYQGSAVKLTIPVSVDVPVPPPAAVASATGPAVETIHLTAGLSICEIAVSGNASSYGSATNVIIKLYAPEGASLGWSSYDLLVNKIATSGQWERVVRPTLAGNYLVEADVALTASWSIACD